MSKVTKVAQVSKRKITLALAAIALMGGLGYTTTIAVARAHEGSSHPFIQKIAERFNLNEDEVIEVFEEIHAERFAQMQERKEERLTQAVENGVITEEQKQALLEKWQEKLAHRQQHQEEMQEWSEEQGIDHAALRDYMGFGHKGFRGFAKYNE